MAWTAKPVGDIVDDPKSKNSIFTAIYTDADSTPPRTHEPGGLRSTSWRNPSAYDPSMAEWQWEMQNTLFWLTDRDAKAAANPVIDGATVALVIATADNRDPKARAKQLAYNNVLAAAQQVTLLSGAKLAAGDASFDLAVENLEAAKAASATAIADAKAASAIADAKV